MKAEIIAIGTELLLGDVVNTNSAFIAGKLAGYGINVYRHTTIGDNAQRLCQELTEAFLRCSLVICTGGLGPTVDDITKDVAAKYFGQKLVLHEQSLKQIEAFFDNLGVEMGENNKKQAYFPENAEVWDNPWGTAPACVIKSNKNALILLPGPPFEMKNMFKRHVDSYLQSLSQDVLVSKTIRLVGIGESSMEELVKDIIDSQTYVTIAPYASAAAAETLLRLTAMAKDKLAASELIEPVCKKLEDRLKPYIYGYDDDRLCVVVLDMLKSRGLTLCCAESFTGGSFAKEIVKNEGASAVLKDGIVCYSNQSKVDRLGVNQQTLEKYGAVSEQTAKEMAVGAYRSAKADVAISFTGNASPVSCDKNPTGTAFIAVFYNNNIVVQRFKLIGSRQRIMELATAHGLNMIRKILEV